MLLFPNAKINIGLDVIEKRADGYHNISSCFYPIPWYDVLEVLPADEFELRVSGISLSGNENDNLCSKVYHLLKQDFELPAVKIHLLKVIPIGAGLGGGSSDASFLLKFLNDHFDLKLDQNSLSEYAKKIGSDCPFFFKNKPQLVYDTGDRFEDVNLNLSGKYLHVVTPPIHISTAEAYSAISPSAPDISIKEILHMPLKEWRKLLKNDFECHVFSKHRVIKDVKELLYARGALYASMSGSGSSIYGIYDREVTIGRLPDGYTHWHGNLAK